MQSADPEPWCNLYILLWDLTEKTYRYEVNFEWGRENCLIILHKDVAR